MNGWLPWGDPHQFLDAATGMTQYRTPVHYDRIETLSQTKFSIMESLDAMTSPSICQWRPYDPARHRTVENVALMSRFISLGRNCEFGDAQRKCGYESLDLFRWASTPAHVLLRLLRDRFAGIGDDLSVFGEREHMVRSGRYGFIWHAHAPDLTADQVLDREQKRLPRMAAMLLDHIADGDRIFVRHNGANGPEETQEIFEALRAIGPRAVMLHVAEGNTPLRETASGLLLGTIPAFSDPAAVPTTTCADYWLALCAEAFIHQHGDALEISSPPDVKHA